MNIKLFPLIFLFGFFGIVNSFAQETGIKTEYLKDEGLTKVATNMLYVGNAADQFVEIQFAGSYKGEKLAATPRVDISVYSFSKEPIFKKDKDRILVIIANGTETTVGTLTSSTFKGETKNGIDTYFTVGGDPNAGMQVSLPQGAAIRAGGTMTGMTMELLTLQLKPEQFLKMAASPTIRFKIGPTILTPTSRQVEIIHNFAEQLTAKQ